MSLDQLRHEGSRVNRGRPKLTARVIRALRGRPTPLSTGDLARLCARDRSRGPAITLTVLLKLEGAGLVTRHPPVVRGPGRPAWRWTLVAPGARV